jgi:DNA-binding response OmpR family regulator
MNSPVNILLIEDNEFFANIIYEVFVQENYQCKIAPSIAHAIKMAKANEFNLCVCDYNIPDSYGFESIKRLKHVLNSPILLISGESCPSDLSRMQDKMLIDSFIHKPFGRDILLTEVRKAILTD